MHKIYDLKEMLCDELEEYGSKDKLDVGSLDVVDKLAHAIKNIDKIIEADEEGYSGNYMDGRSYRRSYARRRDSMGRYSRAADDVMMELRKMIDEAPDERTRSEYQRILHKIEKM